MASLLLIVCFLSFSSAAVKQEKPEPYWPEIFNFEFVIYVEEYGKDWNSTGDLNYHWPNKTFRSDFYKWCIPLFDSGPGEFNNYTCSFVATKGNMYFVNHTSDVWADNNCCLFEAGLGAVPPDFTKTGNYNGTGTIRDVKVDVWWWPGTSDPENGCFAYWNFVEEPYTPVRFYGLTSVGPAILDFYNFKPNVLMEGTDLSLPLKGCDEECKPPVLKKRNVAKKRLSKYFGAPWPEWPVCE